MKAVSLRNSSGLMLALDVEDATEAEEIIVNNLEYIDAVKLGTTLLVSPNGGLGLVSKIRYHYNLPVLIDSKLKDVQHILLSTIRSYITHGATGVTIWADIGRKALQFLFNTLEDDVDLVVLTALTSLSFEEIEHSAKNNILMAVDCGCKILQIPGNFPQLITWARQKIPLDIMIVSCGVGRQGGKVGDAISCGGNYEIIGRHILDNKNVHNAFKESSNTIRVNLKNLYKDN